MHGASRVVADANPGYPCRVSLRDAEPGETLLLLPWRHLDMDTPYRSGGPIFVRETAAAQAVFRNEIPEQQRSRLLSVRAYDARGWRHARRGCYACRVDRAA